MGFISPRAIDAYSERHLCDSRKAKRFTYKQLNHMLRALHPVPKFHTKPRKHQRVGFLLGAKYPGYLFLFDMGLGKTKLMLDLFSWRKRCKGNDHAKRMLVLVPNAANVQGWMDEIVLHAPHLTVQGLVGSVDPATRFETLCGTADVVVTTYRGLQSALCKRVTVPKRKNKKMTHQPRLSAKVAACFDMLVPDESTFFRNHTSTTYRCVKAIAKRVKFTHPLTGTPMGGNPHALWAQFNVGDGGETFGETLGLFRNYFFKEVDDYWAGSKLEFDRSMRKELTRFMRHRSIRYRDTECEDLPPLVRSTRKVVFDNETWKYYDKLVTELRAAQGNFKLVDNAWHRLRQICSGHLPYRDSENAKHYIDFTNSPKLDTLLDDLRAVPQDRKVLVFAEYKHTGAQVIKRVKDLGMGAVRLYGGTTNSAQVVTKFKTDPRCRCMVVNSQSGGFGLNLQVANYVFVFETPVCPIVRKQLEKRAWRMGQKHTVYLYDYVVQASVEIKIQQALAAGRNLFKQVVDGDVSI